jgi:hypothetical protein
MSCPESNAAMAIEFIASPRFVPDEFSNLAKSQFAGGDTVVSRPAGVSYIRIAQAYGQISPPRTSPHPRAERDMLASYAGLARDGAPR